MNNNVPGETPGQKASNLTDGHDDPNRGPLDRAANVLQGTDDPNRGPLDRAANAITGGTGGVSAAMSGRNDDPTRGPVDRAQNAVDGYDDPNRGPLDRAANALTGHGGGVEGAMAHDDPNRGPLDRAANALDGRDDPTRGPLDRAANALDGHDDPNRGPLDRAANAVTGGVGGVAAATAGTSSYQQSQGYTSGHGSTGDAMAATARGGVVSAIFDTQEEAQSAVRDLRAAGVPDAALSVIAQSGRTTTTTDGSGEVVDEEHSSYLRGILGGGALGAGLAIAALAIPGVGPLAAAGAIAAGAVPGAAATGALIGAAAGSLNEALKGHGVSDEDATYYSDRMSSGGVFVSVDTRHHPMDAATAADILYRNGGHNAGRARM